MAAQHTPGPWTAKEMFSGSWDIYADNGDGSTLARTEGAADAHLIAKAPELLATCEAVRESLLVLARHPAFGDDAPEFNEGGVGHAACGMLRRVLDELASA